MRWRTGSATIGAVVLVLALSGCAGWPPVNCTLEAWTDTVHVRVPGSGNPGSGVEGVGFCQQDGCTPGLLTWEVDSAPTASDGATPTAPTGALPTPSSSLSPSTIHDGDVWTVQTPGHDGDHGRVALFGADQRVLVQRDVRLTWVRTGGTEQCGGPSTATVTVELP